jgi:hypothetical protein
MEGGRRNSWLAVATLFAFFCFVCLVWVSVQNYSTWRSQQQSEGPPGGDGQPSASPSSLPSPEIEAFIPPDAILVDTLEANLDADSDTEIMLVFNRVHEQPDQAGIVILDYAQGSWRAVWEANPALGGPATKAEIRDTNLDGNPEMLVFSTSEGQDEHVLCIYTWDGTDYVLLAPSGGSLEGEQCFTSAFYAPEFRNVDIVDVEEILVYEDDPSHARLLARPYYWDGEAYSYASWLVILGRPRPSSEGTE